MDRSVIVELVRRLPAGALSRAWGVAVRWRRPRAVVALAKRLFVLASGADLSEAVVPESEYESLEDLFVRRLHPGARPVDPSEAAVVSPVDGVVGECGVVERGTLLQVKGRAYSLARLLDDPGTAERFEGGPYATLYLAPGDYHRIHAPLSGAVSEAAVVPGRLLPVFPESLARVDELFATNERFITYIDAPLVGRLAVVKVGATLVGRIGVAYDPQARTNRAGARARRMRYDPPWPVSKGDELGVFELGSTVVLVGERGPVRFDALVPGEKIRMGERIGTLLAVDEAGPRPSSSVARRAPARQHATGSDRRPRRKPPVRKR